MIKYSKAQKRAYYAGMGYRFGKEGKKMNVKPANMSSFTNGYKRVKNVSEKAEKASWAKPKRKSTKKTEIKK